MSDLFINPAALKRRITLILSKALVFQASKVSKETSFAKSASILKRTEMANMLFCAGSLVDESDGIKSDSRSLSNIAIPLTDLLSLSSNFFSKALKAVFKLKPVCCMTWPVSGCA